MSGKHMSYAAGSGAMGLLKDGYKHFSGVQEAVLKNTEAVKNFSEILRTSMGPNGMNKMVINHLDKLFVTSDAATIVGELEVQHPAAKMIVMASKQQEQEFGDGTGFVVTFSGELMKKAEELIKMGLHTSDIVKGYKLAWEFCMNEIDSLSVAEVKDLRNTEELVRAIKPVLAAKQRGYENILAPLVVKACQRVFPHVGTGKAPVVNTDSVRIGKLMGSNLAESHVVDGMVIPRLSLSSVKFADNAKVAVFGCGVEAAATEAKSTVLINNAEDLINYNKSEEKMMEATIKAIYDSGVKIIIAGGPISEMGLHFIQKYDMAVFKIVSKFMLRRLCRTFGATAVTRLGAVTPDEVGIIGKMETLEFGSNKLTVFRQQTMDTGRIATIVLRASTQNLLDDLERAIIDGVNTVKSLCKNPNLVAGAGACEIELASRVQKLANSTKGLEQYAIRKYGEAFEVFPRTLGENGGSSSTDLISKLYAAHANGKNTMGVDIDETNALQDTMATGVLDCLATKKSALNMASDATTTVLRVDQIIMSKQAGGQKK